MMFFSTVEVPTSLGTGAKPFSIRAKGKGLAFGKVADRDNIVDSEWDMYVRDKQVAVDNKGFSGYAETGNIGNYCLLGDFYLIDGYNCNTTTLLVTGRNTDIGSGLN